MQLNSFPIGLDLLVSLGDYFYQGLLGYAKHKILLHQMLAT